MALLPCPLCGAEAAPEKLVRTGECPGCGALIAGGGESAPEAVAVAIDAWGADGIDPPVLTRRLFEVEPAPAPAPTAAITSDRREGFYLWWVFVRPAGEDAAAVLRGFIGSS